MKKGINIIVLGVLTVVSVILALPFTPLRNSFKGVTTNAADRALTSMGVDMNRKIRNARLIARSHEYESYNFIIDGSNGKKYVRQNFYSGTTDLQANGLYVLSTENDNRQNFSGMNPSLLSGSVRKKNISSKMNELATVTTNPNSQTSNNGSKRQNANSDNNGSGGGTHPGVDPMPLPSLPLGNGFLAFFSLALAYVIFKKWD